MTPPDLDARALAEALAPLLRRTGGEIIPSDAARVDDVAVAVEGGPVVHVRLPGSADDAAAESADLSDGLARLIADVERDSAVRSRSSRGAASSWPSGCWRNAAPSRCGAPPRRSEALGVTRFTVYDYLNRRSTA